MVQGAMVVTGEKKVLIDLTGIRFGSLLVLHRDLTTISKGKTRWVCKCDCGNTLSIRGSHLREGQKKCLKCVNHNHNIKHGMHGHPNYTIWAMMKQRCLNENAVGYANYGGRGIRICDRWMDFEKFVKDVGVRPTKKHSLDRIDVDGNYEPSNFRWVTDTEQMRNKRDNRVIAYMGKSKPVSEWAEILGVNSFVLYSRLNNGWDVYKAFNTPIRVNLRYISEGGFNLTVKEWSLKTGLSIDSINYRIRKGKKILSNELSNCNG